MVKISWATFSSVAYEIVNFPSPNLVAYFKVEPFPSLALIFKTMRPVNSSNSIKAEWEVLEWTNILAFQWETYPLQELNRRAAPRGANIVCFFMAVFLAKGYERTVAKSMAPFQFFEFFSGYGKRRRVREVGVAINLISQTTLEESNLLFYKHPKFLLHCSKR